MRQKQERKITKKIKHMSYIIKGSKDNYEVVIGCEIHAQISSKSKLFSRSSTEFGAKQNSQVSLIDAAMPGMLPTINIQCVKQAIKTGFGLNAKINNFSVFDRKNYFYPDLPQGYQISQFYHPIIGEGNVEITLEDDSKKTIGIERIHLEQDAGKSIHDQDPELSFIDLNRSGIALMEIVSKPDLSSPYEAAQYVKTIRSIVRALETCDGDMEKGNLRCDANVSVRKIGQKELGTRCEIKNLNSMRNIARAIEFEAGRQVDIIEQGGVIDQETRLFDALIGETKTMRSKEDAMDYRYFPDPDLPPLNLSQEFIDDIKNSINELPEAKKQRYINNFNLSSYDASVITADNNLITYFEEIVKNHDPKLVVTWLCVELLGRINKLSIDIKDCNISPKKLSQLLDLIKNNEISGKIAKDVLDEMIQSGKEAKIIVDQKGLKQLSNTAEIELIIDQILANNQDKVTQYKSGKDKLFGFFIGQIMKETKGKANPQIVNKILQDKLSK